MPPKNKKQLQQEAKRLEEQQKKKQQEEKKLEQERKKYASETLITGLVLPVSNQLLTEFATHSISFIHEKLTHILKSLYSTLTKQKLIKQILKEMAYVIKNSKQLFSLPEKCSYEGNQLSYLKVRILCGIFLKVFLNEHPQISEENSLKNRQKDQELLKQLLMAHSLGKTQKQMKTFDRKQIVAVLQFFKKNYFDHFLVLQKTNNFPKREDEKVFHLYISSPWAQHNTSETVFIDLSGHVNQSKQATTE